MKRILMINTGGTFSSRPGPSGLAPELTGGEIAAQLGEAVGWNKNTTYTVIKKCMEKRAIRREEPDFVCHPLAERETVQREETEALIEKMFGGSSELFFSSFLRERGVSEEEAKGLLRLIQKKGGEKE